MEASASAFLAKLEKRRHTITGRARGRLRVEIQMARKQLPTIVSAVRSILHQMCNHSYNDYMSRGDCTWDYRWKPVSHQGSDWRRHREIDYGNVEYASILQFFYLQDRYCACYIDYLVTYWPSIDPCRMPQTSDGIIMQGDIIEICLAALRGHEDFDMTGACQNALLYSIYLSMVQLCQLVQYIDAAVRTGRVKYSLELVTMLHAGTDEAFIHDSWINAWNTRQQGGHCLHALLNQ